MKKNRRPRPVRQFMIVTHRWLSLVLGILLLAITTSGAVLVYKPEVQRWLDRDAYAASGGPVEVSFQEAHDAVLAAHPSYDALDVILDRGVYRVTDYETSWNVDPSTGEILGRAGQHTWIAWLDNLHECSFSCEGQPGYVGWTAKEVPGTGWLGYEGAKVTWAGLFLGVLGLLTLWLSLTGIWLWWPRWRDVKTSMSVRWKRGRFARDTDLHKVVGMIGIPLMLIWGITGAGFELKPVQDVYNALTPGSYVETPDATSTKSDAPDITMDEAVASARKLSDDRIVTVAPPAKDDPTSSYYVYLDTGHDPYAYGGYPGDVGISVDRHTGVATYNFNGPATATSQTIWDAWSYPAHAGYFANGWWRILWFVLGMSPLLLAVTGVSTWLVRHTSTKARRRARKTAETALVTQE